MRSEKISPAFILCKDCHTLLACLLLIEVLVIEVSVVEQSVHRAGELTATAITPVTLLLNIQNTIFSSVFLHCSGSQSHCHYIVAPSYSR